MKPAFTDGYVAEHLLESREWQRLLRGGRRRKLWGKFLDLVKNLIVQYTSLARHQGVNSRKRSCVKLPCVLGLAHCVIDRSFIVRPYKYGLPLSVLAFSIPAIWYVDVRSLIVRSLVFSAPVCITFMHPSQKVKLSAIFLQSFVPKQFFDFRAKFYKDRLRGTHPSGVLNARRVAK